MKCLELVSTNQFGTMYYCQLPKGHYREHSAILQQFFCPGAVIDINSTADDELLFNKNDMRQARKDALEEAGRIAYEDFSTATNGEVKFALSAVQNKIRMARDIP